MSKVRLQDASRSCALSRSDTLQFSLHNPHSGRSFIFVEINHHQDQRFEVGSLRMTR
ncbi:MAG: hypothetical protein ABI456_00375 [Ktedonobacteraceae bacterium]|nr:hypothetical protein [Chloroflexota bacterium]